MQEVAMGGADRHEWREGWTLTLAACAGMTLAPLSVYTMGLFMVPLEQAFGWSRAAISSGVTVTAVVGAILAPFVGMLIDRMGPRRIAIFGALLFGVGFAALSLNNGSLGLWYGLWLVVAIAAVFLKPTVWTAAVVSRFDKARGLAIALALSGSPVTAIAAPPIAGFLIDHYGWQITYIGIAAIWTLFVLPLLILYFFGASDLWRRQNRDGGVAADRPHVAGVAIKEAMASPTFLKLAVSAALATGTSAALVVHFIPMLLIKDISREQAMILASVLGAGGLCGRLFAGVLLDRIDPRWFGTLAFAFPALATTMLMGVDLSFGVAFFVAIILGLGSGAEIEVSSYLTARYFGLRNYGAMFGTIAGLIVLGAGVGPPAMGLTHDRFSTYDPALMIAGPIYLLCAFLIFALPRHVALRAG